MNDPVTDQINKLRAQIEANEHDFLNRWKSHASVSPAVAEDTAVFLQAASLAKQSARGALLAVARVRGNDTLPPAAKRRLIAEALTAGQKAVKEAQERMSVALKVIDADLRGAALPQLDPSRQQAALSEAMMRLNGASDPVAAMHELAATDTDLAAAVTQGTWAESYLRGHAVGTKEAKEAVASIRAAAALSARNSTDPIRRGAGEALAEIGTLHKALDSNNSITLDAMTAATEAAQSLDGPAVAEPAEGGDMP